MAVHWEKYLRSSKARVDLVWNFAVKPPMRIRLDETTMAAELSSLPPPTPPILGPATTAVAALTDSYVSLCLLFATIPALSHAPSTSFRTLMFGLYFR